MKKTYFLSDFHLGIDALHTSSEREQLICRWLEEKKESAEALYLVGDVFDAWFEYKKVIPKGYTRFFGALAAWRGAGIPVYFFTGNHDMWMFRYFTEELDIPIYREPIVRTIHGKHFYMGHGDGLGPSDHGYKFIKKVFDNPFFQKLYSSIHPDIGLPLMRYFSQKSRVAQDAIKQMEFYGEKNEWLIQYSENYLQSHPEIDFFIFGHRHLPINWLLSNERSRYINLGEWLYATSYAAFDGETMFIEFFQTSEFTKLFSNK